MEDKNKKRNNIVHLARLALSGRRQDIQLYIRRIAKQYQKEDPELFQELAHLIQSSPSQAAPVRSASSNNNDIPVDIDSRLQLVRFEQAGKLDIKPIWTSEIEETLERIVIERSKQKQLLKHGLSPTSSLLFTGAPGVGKSLAAKWLAAHLDLPLLTLDLSAVMSSFLGRTGTNVRYVLDYAKSVDCVLFLDELDAVAKKRADVTEVGELKRLVTVLLQEIDDWPSTGLLIAATNHPDLLDPAVWRRFDLNINFPMPDEEQIKKAITLFLGEDSLKFSDWITVLSVLLQNSSYSDIERMMLNIRRNAVVRDKSLGDSLNQFLNKQLDSLSKHDKINVASLLVKTGLSQRKVNELTGVSRDTIRKALAETKKSK